MNKPQSGAGYAQALRAGEHYVAIRNSLGGLLCCLIAYSVLVFAIAMALISLGWLLRGRPSSFSQFSADAMQFSYLEGVVGSHLGLASLIVVTMCVVRYVHKMSPKWLISMQPGMRWRYLLVCALIAVVGLNGVYWISRAGERLQVALPDNAFWWFAVVIVTSPLQAAGEEFLFRGYLTQAVGTLVSSSKVAVLFSAAIFALLHGTQNLPLFVDRFGFGLLAGAMVLLTGGLEASIAAHAVNNVFSFGYAIVGGGLVKARTMHSSTWATTFWDLAAYALTFVVCWWVSKRMNLASRAPKFDVDVNTR